MPRSHTTFARLLALAACAAQVLGGCICGSPRPAFVSPPPVPPCFVTTTPVAIGTPVVSQPIVAPAIAAPAAQVLTTPVLTAPVALEPPMLAAAQQPPVLTLPATVSPAPITAPPVTTAPVAAPTAQLVLSPQRVVAPVGSEVALLSAVRLPDGRLLGGQRIEWILSQESVGNFVDVGEPAPGAQAGQSKLGGDFALGRTLLAARPLLRGSEGLPTNITVPAGYSWATVTSVSEGASHVTAVASETGPSVSHQTATIVWVSAQWSFPPPANVPAGQTHALTTTVTRPDGQPISGWIVRYEIAGGAAAAFTRNGDQAFEVTSDAAGQATAPLTPASPQAGATQVRMVIIYPDQRGERIPIGDGFTTISWSAPGLAIRHTGPAVGSVGASLVYRLEVTNPGNLATRDITVEDTIPQGWTVVSTNPPAEIAGDRIRWRIPELAPQGASSFEIVFRGSREGLVRRCVAARSIDKLDATDCVETRLSGPKATLTLSGPERAQVGEEVKYQAVVVNTGDLPLSGLKVKDQFDAGFVHAEAASPIEKPLKELAPGESQTFGITFRVARAGKICHTLELLGESGVLATTTACVQATEPPPVKLSLVARVSGPQQAQVGQTIEFLIEVTNNGEGDLTNLVITDEISRSLEFIEASTGFRLVNEKLELRIERLPANHKTPTLGVRCRCLQADAAAFNRLSVTSNEKITAADNVSLRIVPAPVQPAPVQPTPAQPLIPRAETQPAQPPGGAAPAAPIDNGGAQQRPATPPSSPASGRMTATLSDAADPLRIGQSGSYQLTIVNDRDVEDESLVVRLLLPDGMRATRWSGWTRGDKADTDGRIIEFQPVRTVRPRETISYMLDVSAPRAGEYRVRAEIRSRLTPEPLVVEQATTVLGT